MQRTPSILLAAGAASIALLCPVQQQASAAAHAHVPADVRIERAVVSAVNGVRMHHGRAPLRRIPTLARPARAHSRQLLAHGSFTHYGPNGRPFWTRLVAAGFPRNRHMAENLAQTPGCGIAVARRTVKMWMASPPHRANLLDRRVRFIGVGAALTRDCSTTMLTADFGS
jgi:uncharacterized protein YkwD